MCCPVVIFLLFVNNIYVTSKIVCNVTYSGNIKEIHIIYGCNIYRCNN